MNQATSEIVIPVADPQPAKFKGGPLFTAAYMILFQFVCHIHTIVSTTIRGRLVAPLRNLWGHCYRQVAFGGEGVAMPHSALGFIINALLALAEIKSQGAPGFPFRTHPRAIMVSVTCLLMYGLASAAELVSLDLTSVYAIAAHLGKLFSLCILVASLASLCYI